MNKKLDRKYYDILEVEKAADEIGYDFNGLHKPNGPNDLYGLGYTDFVVPLVKAVQEQQKMIDNQQAINESLLQQIAELKKQMQELKAQK